MRPGWPVKQFAFAANRKPPHQKGTARCVLEARELDALLREYHVFEHFLKDWPHTPTTLFHGVTND